MDNSNTLAESLRAQGLEVETVADIIEKGSSAPAPTLAFDPPRLENYPRPPLQPGIYFGLDEATYHAAPALSYTGIKRLASSPMLYWATTPWLNPDFEVPEEKDHFNLGHAYDCRIFDGHDAFKERFALALDKADHEGVLITVDDIRKRLDEYGLKGKGTKKDDLFDQLLEWEPDAKLWDRMVAEHAEANEGKVMISALQYRRIEIAARMIENDEEMAAIVKGGHSQVSLFWNCPRTGVPMKARPDKLLIRSIVDMKSLANQRGRSIERAIAYEIADRKYNLQPSVYFEGAAEVRKLVREHGASVIFSADHMRAIASKDEIDAEAQAREEEERIAWAMKWASNTAPDEWLWIFQQTGLAPVTRLVKYPRGGTTRTITEEIVSRMKRRFREMSETYGTDPWLDLAPRWDMADEDIPPFALDI